MHIWDTWYRIAPRRVCNAIFFLLPWFKKKKLPTDKPFPATVHRVILKYTKYSCDSATSFAEKSLAFCQAFSFLSKAGRPYCGGD